MASASSLSLVVFSGSTDNCWMVELHLVFLCIGNYSPISALMHFHHLFLCSDIFIYVSMHRHFHTLKQKALAGATSFARVQVWYMHAQSITLNCLIKISVNLHPVFMQFPPSRKLYNQNKILLVTNPHMLSCLSRCLPGSCFKQRRFLASCCIVCKHFSLWVETVAQSMSGRLVFCICLCRIKYWNTAAPNQFTSCFSQSFWTQNLSLR